MTFRGSVLRVALLAVAALLPASLLSAPAVSAVTPETTYANETFTAINQERTQNGRAALGRNSCLQRFATAQAVRMANSRRLSHQALQPILNRCNLGVVAENVAFGYPSGTATFSGWMASTGHRANILNRRYRQLAIAARQASNGDWYVAAVFGRPL